MISEFRRREDRRGAPYGMPVSVLLPAESIWGYDAVTAAYVEEPRTSWRRLLDWVRELYPKADEKDILRLVGREPED